MSKGSKQRPRSPSVTLEQYAKNWAKVYPTQERRALPFKSPQEASQHDAQDPTHDPTRR